MDRMFGTRYHTAGAELQLPRKVPMRVEPKSFFGAPPPGRRRWGLGARAAAAAWLRAAGRF